ncbi:MAG: DNA methyltransferase [Chloroflexota bacterium]
MDDGMKSVRSVYRERNICPICQIVAGSLGEHIRNAHGEEEFEQAVLEAKAEGMSDPEIGSRFGITFKQLEKLITGVYGINISALKKPKKVKYWAPKDFREETTTVWSFKQRGDWTTHDGRYRGNWSPYIPRNVIVKYSKAGDVVLDYFVGGGTTAVEAKLLGRRCIAMDINPACVGLTLENLNFRLPETFLGELSTFEPEVSVGDARDLSDLSDNSIDLICAHPPYAGIINYSSKVEGDLSKLGIEEFLQEMQKVAKESYRVLKPGRKCAILIGDTRKRKRVVPIGFQTINVFLEVGFKLKELVIKRQHNCKSTGFWYANSRKYNFLLLAHEYLPIFEKPEPPVPLAVKEEVADYGLLFPALEKPVVKRKLDEFETTTVWILPEKDFEKRLNKNVIDRYSNGKGHSTIPFVAHSKNETDITLGEGQKGRGLLFIKSPFLADNPSYSNIEFYLQKTKEFVNRELPTLSEGGFVVIQTQDVRIGEYVEPLAKRIVDILVIDDLLLKEIVIVTQQNQNSKPQAAGAHLKISHQYLLVYKKVDSRKLGK